MAPLTTYTQFQAEASSEKNLLAVIQAAVRLIGWQLHSGSIYKITSFDYPVIVSVKDSGTAYTEVSAIGSISAGKYYHDRENQVLYLQASDSSNPNSRFLVLLFKNYYCHGHGVSAPYDLSTGRDVYWRPLIEDTSEFGVNLDDDNQMGLAVEGSGSISFYNDGTYWRPKFDKWSFENKKIEIYSYNPQLPITEAKIIYRGTIQGQTYGDKSVKFKLKDQLFELRSEIALDNIEDVSGAIIPTALEAAKQRRLYGHVKGHRLTNVDQVLDDGYTLSGTVSITAGSATMTGSGTQFLTDLSPDDQIYIDTLTDPVVVGVVVSDTEVTLSEEASINLSAKTYTVDPDLPKRYTNREWVVSGHALREPSTTVVAGTTPNLFQVNDTTDIEVDSKILVGTEIVEVKRIVPTNQIKTKTNLLNVPSAGTAVKRFAIYNVRINNKLLTYSRDYTYNASTGRLTLDETAEFNIAPNRTLEGTVDFAAASRTISGTDTRFTTQLSPNAWIRSTAQSTWHEIARIVSDTEAELRAVPGFTEASADTLYRAPAVFDGSEDVLSCDCLGATSDGTTTGTFLKTGPQIVKDLITLSGADVTVDTSSFDTAKELAEHKLSVVIPKTYSATKAPTYRDVITEINQSIFGNLIQDADFQLQYHVFRPGRTVSTATRLTERDILKWQIRSEIEKIVKTVRIEYLFKEYDYEVDEKSNAVSEFSNNYGQYVSESKNVYTHETLLVDSTAASTMSQRWAFLLSVALTTMSIQTKLQGERLQISDVIDLEHEKLYQRISSSVSRKIGAVKSASKTMSGAVIEFEDLANAFSRCATITEDGVSDYDTSSETELFYHGFITDTYGMQGNDPDTHGVNLIW